MITFGSVCSGIEAASAAWKPLGWQCAFVSEIAKFPRAVLRHHYPETPLHGDFTTIRPDTYRPIDLLVGGTPCQSFSVAGLRGGMADDRGNLALEFLRLAQRLRPRWLLWENVPGVLSSNGGRDFGSILGGLVELGYGFSYRVLDAQFFGVAQRRRRVFVVGYLGDWTRAAAVLSERSSLLGNPAPRRQTGKAAPTLSSRSSAGGGLGTDFDVDGGLVAGTLNASGKAAGSATQQDAEAGLLVTHSLTGEGFDASEDGTGRGTPLVPVCFTSKDHGADAYEDLAPTLRAGGHNRSHANAGVPPAIAYGLRNDAGRSGEAKTPSIDASGKARLRDAGFNPLEECAPTLDTGAPHAVAFALRGREGGAMPEVGGDLVGALRAASGGSSRDYIAFDLAQITHPRNGARAEAGLPAGTLAKGSSPHVAFSITPSNSNKDYNARAVDRTQALTAGGNRPSARGGDLISCGGVRRLTPRECERLQGYADDYTLIPSWASGASRADLEETAAWLLADDVSFQFGDEETRAARWAWGLQMARHPDGPRYKALGNTMAVPVMRWIGQRIEQVERLYPVAVMA